MHGIENQDSHAKMGVNGQCVQPLCLPASYMRTHWWSMVYAFMVLLLYRLCGGRPGLQGFTGISVWSLQCNTWEPGVGAYLGMGKFLHNQSTSYRHAILWKSVLGDVASQCSLLT